MLKKAFGFWTWMPFGLIVLCWVSASLSQQNWNFWILLILCGVWVLCRLIYVYSRHMISAYREVRNRKQVKSDASATDYMEEDHDVTVAAHPEGILIPKQHTIFEGGNIDIDLDDAGETLAVYRCPRGIWVVVVIISALLLIASGIGIGRYLGTYEVVKGYSAMLLALIFGAVACYAAARLHGARIEICERALVTYLTDSLVCDMYYYRNIREVLEVGDDLKLIYKNYETVLLRDKQWRGVAAAAPHLRERLTPDEE